MEFPQTTVDWDFKIGKLGQLYLPAANYTSVLDSKPALVDIQPGDLLEEVFDATTQTYSVRPAQAASGALVSLAGVAIFKSARQPVAPPYSGTVATGYQPGDMVTYCRKGIVFAKWNSTNGTSPQVAYTVPKYAHSSTTPGPTQGAFTDKATSSTAGSEVDTLGGGVLIYKDVTGALGFGVCLVELNLPSVFPS